MNLLLCNLTWALTVILAIQLTAKATLDLKNTSNLIHDDWQREIQARRCAEVQAFAQNLHDAAEALRKQHPLSANKIADATADALRKIEAKNTNSICGWESLNGQRYEAVPHLQRSREAALKNLPNWVVAIRKNADGSR